MSRVVEEKAWDLAGTIPGQGLLGQLERQGEEGAQEEAVPWRAAPLAPC